MFVDRYAGGSPQVWTAVANVTKQSWIVVCLQNREMWGRDTVISICDARGIRKKLLGMQNFVGFEVLTASVIIPCSQSKANQCFGKT
jgi:hypothetical protein